MPDNTQINTNTSSGDFISTDDLTTLNGGAVSGVKVQRVKVGFGSDAVQRDVDSSNPLPVLVGSDADNTATGTLAAAAQTVVLSTAGKSSANIKITNTWVGTITFEGTTDGTTWDSINAVASSTSTPQTTTTVNGSFRLTPASFIQIRVIMTLWTSGTATISMRSSMATGGIFANQILPVTIISNPAEGVVSVGNSTVVNLAANAVFTGTAEDITLLASIKTTIYTSHVSATNGLTFQQSHDGVLWIPLTDAYTIPALVQRPFSIPPNMKWYRVVYTNGPTLTTTLVIQTIYHKSDKQPSSVRPQDSRSNENDFVEILSYLMGYNSLTDAWNRIGITNAVTGGNENLVDRIKVNAALRMIDNAQPSGSKLVNVTGTQALGMDVNMSDRAVRLLGVLSAGTNVIGKFGIDQTTPGTTNAVSISTAQKATYRASTIVVLIPAVTSPNPWFTIYGSATKTIRIQSIIISGLTLTAIAYLNLGVRRYSTAVSGGTSTALTMVKADTNAANATATNLNVYTAIPTAGTTVGDIASRRKLAQATTATSASIVDEIEFYFNPGGDGTFVTLRGVAEGVGLYWITAPASAVSLLLHIEFTEE